MDFAKKTFSIFKVDVGAHTISYLLRIVIARMLGPSNFGIFSLVHLLPEYAEKLLRFSVDDASIHISGKKEYKVGEVFINSAFTMLCLSFLPIILFILQGDIFYKFILKDPSINRLWVWITLLSIPFIFLFRSIIKMLLFLEKINIYNNLIILTSLGGYVLGIISIILFKAGTLGILSAITFTYLIAVIIGLWIMSKLIPLKFSLKSNLIKDLFIYGFKIQIPNTLFYLHLRIDMLIVAFFLTPKEVGYYALAVSLAEVLRKIPNAVLFLLYSRTSKLPDEKAKNLTAKSCRNTFAILCVVSIPFYLVVKMLMPILGKDFSPIVFPFVALIPGVIALGIGQLLMMYFYGKGNPEDTILPVLMGLIVNILINFWLIPKIGILGASLSSSISYIVFAILLVKLFQNKESVSTREILILDRADLKFYRKFLIFELFGRTKGLFINAKSS